MAETATKPITEADFPFGTWTDVGKDGVISNYRSEPLHYILAPSGAQPTIQSGHEAPGFFRYKIDGAMHVWVTPREHEVNGVWTQFS